MPPIDRLVSFAAAAFAIIIVPGPSVLFVISRAVALGRRAALATVLGNTTGVFVQAIAVALGLGVVVERSVAVFTVIKLAGAAYLVFLGVRAIRERRSLSAALDQKIVARPTRQIIREGFWVGLGNPKAAIFFAAILPQFVDRHRGNVPVQMIMLGLVFSAIAMVSDSAWGLLAGTARQWFARSPRRLEAVGGAGGLVIIGLGVRLALIGRQD